MGLLLMIFLNSKNYQIKKMINQNEKKKQILKKVLIILIREMPKRKKNLNQSQKLQMKMMKKNLKIKN